MPRGFFFLAVVLPAMCYLVADGVQRPAVAGFSETPSAGHVVVSIFEELWVDARAAAEREFSVSSVPGGKELVLRFWARLDAPSAGGYTGAMKLWLNGTAIDVGRLLNKRPSEQRVDGVIKNMASMGGTVFTVDYAANFSAVDQHPTYALRRREVRSCEYEFRVTDLLKTGQNTLRIENVIRSPLTNPLVLVEAQIVERDLQPVAQREKAATDPLPFFEPTLPEDLQSTVETPAENLIDVTVAGDRFRIESIFSTPAGRWEKSSNRYFRFHRRILNQREAVIVEDTFTNLTDDNLPLMQRHEAICALSDESSAEWQRVWVAGLSPVSKVGLQTEPANPTVFGIAQRAGIGMLPLNDEFLVHVANRAERRRLTLADENFVLRPKKSYTAQWAIIPVIRERVERPWKKAGCSEDAWLESEEPYFAFVNSVRRLRGVNFTIPGSFAFLRADPNWTGMWSDEQITRFVRWKNAHFLCSSIDYPRYKAFYPHGTAFQAVDHSYRKQHIARLRQLVPEAVHLVYYHCFIDPSEGAEERFSDARLLLPDGSQGNYGRPHEKLFFPTESNSFGKVVAKNIDVIFDAIGADGVYWDEMEYSRYAYHYGEPWDGVSADIDPRTLRITRLKSSVPLLTQAWRVALAKAILARGALVANGAPYTRTMAELHFPRFVETGSISNCRRAHLFTPIALGDHLTESGECDAYRNMWQALEFGCLYYWYYDLKIIPTHPHLTSYMFPCTPVELHQGFILAEERILTNRSGVFGWGDHAPHEVHVFDQDGREIRKEELAKYVKAYQMEGKSWTELRLPVGFAAAIIRKTGK